MNALHSHLDALAFDYATFGFFTLVNNHWTWFALLTAALSLWKIRAKPHSPSPSTPPSIDRNLKGSLPAVDEQPVGKFVLHETPAGTTADVFSAGDGDGDVLIKGKFTVHYEEDWECESDEEFSEKETETAAFCNGVCNCKSEWCEKWDKMLAMRMGVKEWYMHQDLTNLNGKVVRFWDSGINGNSRFAEQVMYSSRCIVW